MSYETCFLCDSDTGRAGAGDDSIYDERGNGPYCLECYNKQIPARLRESKNSTEHILAEAKKRRAEWIRNNAAMFAVVRDASTNGAICWAEEVADELIKRGYL